jgi:hypothetical protein
MSYLPAGARPLKLALNCGAKQRLGFLGLYSKTYKPVGTRSYSTSRLRHHIRTVSATRFIPHRFTRPHLKLVASLAYNLPQTRMSGAR